MAQHDFGGGPWREHGSDIWGGRAGPPPHDFRKSSYADTRCRVSAFGPPAANRNYVFTRFSNLRPTTGRPWRASEPRPLMRFAREVWNPAEMGAMFSFYNPPKIPDPTWAAGERSRRPSIGWIAWLPSHLAARAKYPADVEVETLEDGGGRTRSRPRCVRFRAERRRRGDHGRGGRENGRTLTALRTPESASAWKRCPESQGKSGAPKGNRTPVFAVKGRRPGPLDDGR
jgi:hypothetical protein